MTGLLVLREQLKSLCGKYEVYLIPVGKFITAMITFIIMLVLSKIITKS